MFVTKKISPLFFYRQQKFGTRFVATICFLTSSLIAAPINQAKAEAVIQWDMGVAVPLGNVTYTSTATPLVPEAPVFFQTTLAAGYRFNIRPWFFIAPMGYYRLTAGVLEYRDTYPSQAQAVGVIQNHFYQHQFLGNDLAAGFDIGFVIKRWTITSGFYVGGRYSLTQFNDRDFATRTLLSPAHPWVSAGWQLILNPRLSVDYRIVDNIDLGGSVDYSFTTKTIPQNNNPAAQQDFINAGLRATFHF